MARRWRLTPGQWRSLPRAEQAELLAEARLHDEERQRLLTQMSQFDEDLAGVSILAQVMISLAD